MSNNNLSIFDQVMQIALEKNTSSKHSTMVTETVMECYDMSSEDGEDCHGCEPIPEASFESIKWDPRGDRQLNASRDEENPKEYE